MVRWVSDGKTQEIKMMSRKRCTFRTSMMKNPSTESQKAFPPLVSYLLSQRWPPLREKELRADCSSFLFSSRMQAFNRLVDHVTYRLPLSVELAKAHTEHAQSVQISNFFSPEIRATTNSGSHFIAGKDQKRYGEAIETWSSAVYHRNQEQDRVILNLLSSLKRSLSPLSPTQGPEKPLTKKTFLMLV